MHPTSPDPTPVASGVTVEDLHKQLSEFVCTLRSRRDVAFRAFQSAAFNQGFELQLYVEAAFMVESQIVSAMVDMLASADSARVAVAAQMTLIARDSQVRR